MSAKNLYILILKKLIFIFKVYTMPRDIRVFSYLNDIIGIYYNSKPIYLNKQEIIYNILHPNDIYNLTENYYFLIIRK